MMSEKQFWEIIAESRRRVDRTKCRDDINFGDDFQDEQIKQLTEILTKLPPEQIVEYELRRFELGKQLYRWDIWNAVYWIHGGCGDDSFSDFRACLISLGKQRYGQVVENPDCLAEIEDERDVPFMLSEGFQYVGPSVYEETTGHEMDTPSFPDWPREPVGERFDENDREAVKRKYPRIYAKYPKMGD